MIFLLLLLLYTIVMTKPEPVPDENIEMQKYKITYYINVNRHDMVLLFVNYL